MNEIFLTEYEKERMQEKLVNSAFKEGMDKGEKNKQMEIAKTMLEDGEPLEKISKYTSLSIEEIKNI